MNELITLAQNVEKIVVDSDYSIVDFEDKKKMLTMISEKLKTIEITEENIKENKKLLARIRKAVREIDEFRKERRRKALEPYNNLAEQVKELKSIIQEGDECLDEQIKELEEIERDRKNDKISEIFNKRIAHYPHIISSDYIYFIEQKYLNKSFSIDKVESIMSEWLEQTEHDLKYIKEFSIDYDLSYSAQRTDYFLKLNRSLALFLDRINRIKEEKEIEESKTDTSKEAEETENNCSEEFTSLQDYEENTYISLKINVTDFKKLVPLMELCNIVLVVDKENYNKILPYIENTKNLVTCGNTPISNISIDGIID